MKVINTADPQVKPSVVMLIYGEGGVGKTSFAATAPNPILADCENGAKYFGLRGIKLDVAQIQNWTDMNFQTGFGSILKGDKYETVIIDPVGELMEKLKAYMIQKSDRKLVQGDGSPSMAGWGWLKDTMRSYIKVLRDLNKHIIIIAHVSEEKDEERMVKRPLIQTKISSDLVNMVDIVGYFTVARGENGEEKRVIYVDPANDKIVCKDRTGQLGKYIEPDFSKIIRAVQGTETFKWSKAPKQPAVESKLEETGQSVKPVSKAPAKPKQVAKEPIRDEDIPVIDTDEPVGDQAQLSKTREESQMADGCPQCGGPITLAERQYSLKMYKSEMCRGCQKEFKATMG